MASLGAKLGSHVELLDVDRSQAVFGQRLRVVEVGRRPGWQGVPPAHGELIDTVQLVREIQVVLVRLLVHARIDRLLGRVLGR